jgi:hypothetical protein
MESPTHPRLADAQCMTRQRIDKAVCRNRLSAETTHPPLADAQCVILQQLDKEVCKEVLRLAGMWLECVCDIQFQTYTFSNIDTFSHKCAPDCAAANLARRFLFALAHCHPWHCCCANPNLFMRSPFAHTHTHTNTHTHIHTHTHMRTCLSCSCKSGPAASFPPQYSTAAVPRGAVTPSITCLYGSPHAHTHAHLFFLQLQVWARRFFATP